MPYPAGMYGSFNDIYPATSELITSGRLRHGQEFWDAEKGKRYRFVKANAAIAANKACKYDPSQADPHTVIATAAETDYAEGVNTTGQTVASGSSFFMLVEGECTPLVATSIAAGVALVPSSTSGQLAAADGTGAEKICAVTKAASGAGGATACRFN